MATNISYVLKHKSKFFDILLNDLQTVSKEYQKRLKKVGILRVKKDINFDSFLFSKSILVAQQYWLEMAPLTK